MCTSAKDNEINTGWIWCEDSSSGLRTSRASILICAQTFCRNCWLCTCKLDVCTSALLCVFAPLTVFPAVSVRTPVGKIQDVNSHQSARLSFIFFYDMFSALIFIFPLWRSGSQELVPFGLVRFFYGERAGTKHLSLVGNPYSQHSRFSRQMSSVFISLMLLLWNF